MTDDTHAIVKDTSKAVEELSSAQHHDVMRRWLSPPDPSTNYNQALKERHTGTGQWLLDDPRYSWWKKEPATFLWLHGIPGCGKTVLSATVIGDLKDGARVKSVLYFYFAFSDARKQCLDHAMRALILQLYDNGQAEVRKPLEECFAQNEVGRQQPSLKTLCRTFQQMARHAGDLWVVLDALDECKVEHQQRRELLEWTLDLQVENSNLHLLVTSRNEHDIKSAIERLQCAKEYIPLHGELVSEDIGSYVRERVRNGRGFKRWRSREHVQQEIEDSLTERADGM